MASFYQPLIDTLMSIYLQIIHFIPDFITGLMVLLVGWLITKSIRWLIALVLRKARFDDIVERTGVTYTLQGVGMTSSLSSVIADTVYWYLLFYFLIASFKMMHLDALADVLQKMLDYLPNALGALVTIVLGGILAKMSGDLIGHAIQSMGITYGKPLGKVIQYLMSLFVVILALGVLGLDTNILVSSVTILMAAVGLAVALSFGLGSRSLSEDLVAGHYVRRTFRPGQHVTVGKVRGSLKMITPIVTWLETEQGDVAISNRELLSSGTVREEVPAET